jgi:hypothetical protein
MGHFQSSPPQIEHFLKLGDLQDGDREWILHHHIVIFAQGTPEQVAPFLKAIL